MIFQEQMPFSREQTAFFQEQMVISTLKTQKINIHNFS